MTLPASNRLKTGILTQHAAHICSNDWPQRLSQTLFINLCPISHYDPFIIGCMLLSVNGPLVYHYYDSLALSLNILKVGFRLRRAGARSL